MIVFVLMVIAAGLGALLADLTNGNSILVMLVIQLALVVIWGARENRGPRK